MSRTTVSIADIVGKTDNLPTMPAVAVKVMRETQSSNSSAQSIARILATDQALSARVLRLANSSFYGLQRRVTNLSEAVVVLGMKSVKNLAVVASTYTWLRRPLEGYKLGPEEMWRHAIGTAVGAKIAAGLSRRADPEAAFTCGLLHDIGKVALSVWLENKVNAILLYSQREGIPFDQAERKVLGYDHCQVGHYLAKEWNLPDEILAACLWHHEPSGADSHADYVDCVHVGDYLTSAMGLGLGGDGLAYAFDESTLTRLGIPADDFDRVADLYVTEFESLESMMLELAA